MEAPPCLHASPNPHAQRLSAANPFNKVRLDNRWGCSAGNALLNFNPLSRLDAHPRPSGASA